MTLRRDWTDLQRLSYFLGEAVQIEHSLASSHGPVVDRMDIQLMAGEPYKGVV